MFTIKKILVAGLLLVFTSIINFSIANESRPSESKADAGSLKLVMQGLLKDTQALTAAVFTEDYAAIGIIANNIAEHPKPSMATRKKLMKAMGSDMAKFKANDTVVHNAAVNMVKSAQQKNIQLISEDFQKMIGGCVSCHSEFKEQVFAILKLTVMP